ncbi:hypothetical protein HDV04_000908 [Boothiomyces sp. JEL0838]|nr:hypothetical protein HDV04_000859 [Boothiomyces sp. JEL0838]KAJ3314185.1 hypothetical protein HDV04_000908 [Boothiomyces sp. JEL0838]
MLEVVAGVWIVAEVCFIWSTAWRYGKKLPNKSHLPDIDETVYNQVLTEICNTNSVTDPKSFIEGWFFGKDISEIGREDILEWIAGMFFNKTTELDENQQLLVLDALEQMEARLGHKFEEKERKVDKMLLTCDSVNMLFRPMAFYASIRGFDFYVQMKLWRINFVFNKESGMVSYFRRGTSSKPNIVFFHGIGIGVAAYIRFINALVKRFPKRTIILFEMPSIAMKLNLSYCLPKEYSEKVASRLNELGLRNNILIGHSLGTMCIRWMDLYYPELVQARIFIDPVCFALWTHHIAKNYIYRDPKTIGERVMLYLTAMEPGIATYLRRYFVWFENTYFSSHLPKNASIFLAEKDEIVDSMYVKDYLYRHSEEGRNVSIVNDATHGQMMLAGCYNDIFNDIISFI